MSVVNKPVNIDFSKVTLSDPKKFGNQGAAMSYLNYNGVMNSLYVQTPKVLLTFDAKYYADNDTNGGKYAVVFSLPDNDSDPNMKPFIDKMNELDQHLIDVAFERRALWFKNGKKLTRETIETEKHTPLIKVSTDPESGEPNGKYAPTFKFKIVKKDVKHECSVYDPHKNTYNIDNEQGPDFVNLEDILKKGTSMEVILKCNGVWLINGNFGCTFRAEQVKVTEKVSKSLGKVCAFIEDDDDEVVKDVFTKSILNDVVDDNPLGDEYDSEDETPHPEVSEPEPEPQPKKKVVRRVKKTVSP